MSHEIKLCVDSLFHSCYDVSRQVCYLQLWKWSGYAGS